MTLFIIDGLALGPYESTEIHLQTLETDDFWHWHTEPAKVLTSRCRSGEGETLATPHSAFI